MTTSAATLLGLLRAGAVLTVDAGTFYAGRWTPLLSRAGASADTIPCLRDALDELEAAGEIVALPSGTGVRGVVRWGIAERPRGAEDAAPEVGK